MGLQNQLADVSGESIPIILVVLIATGVRYLRSLLLTILHSLRLYRFDQNQAVVYDNNLLNAVGSSLAGLTLLAEQLNLNRVFAYPYSNNSGNRDEPGAGAGGSDCVVCLNRFGKGDQVRKLACGHVFHKDCFDGWLDHLNFNCPLCRSQLVSVERVELTQGRVTDDFLAWFSWR